MASTTLENQLVACLPDDADYASARHVVDRASRLMVRNGVVEPSAMGHDEGVMISVWRNGGIGYAATSDLSDAGLRAAADRASAWADTVSSNSVVEGAPLLHTQGEYRSPVETPFATLDLADQVQMLVDLDAAMAVDDRIVDREAMFARHDIDSLLVTNGGGRVYQESRQVFPDMRATANEGSNTQSRTYGYTFCGQGGVELLDRHGWRDAAARIGEEAIVLLEAPNCPSGRMDIILAPDQMVLQIHESIGHPLELDRILGDERNYAGTSFVTQDMFGSYQYGSELLNVTFDPTVPGQMASYAFDDDGTPAERTYLIKDGILQRPMGGTISQSRTGMAGVANSRASGWNRPPIDRMANLNVEPGDSTVEELIAGVERGVLMETNVSWSIDDSRNKFQFGAELGRIIEDGEITGIVRNPNYRGISATFWRNLTGVADDFSVMGVANCGKGEPNQVIRVGHAAPHCRFADVEVFGGEE